MNKTIESRREKLKRFLSSDDGVVNSERRWWSATGFDFKDGTGGNTESEGAAAPSTTDKVECGSCF